MQKSRTYIAIPPGMTIKEILSDRGMSQKEFAIRMDLSAKHISRLINGEVQLTQDVALRLESVLGMTASFWNKLESNYRETLTKLKMIWIMTKSLRRCYLTPKWRLLDGFM